MIRNDVIFIFVKFWPFFSPLGTFNINKARRVFRVYVLHRVNTMLKKIRCT